MVRNAASLMLMTLMLTTGAAIAQPALVLDGKTYSVDDLAHEQQGAFYDLEKKKYELIEQLAHEKVLESFFDKLAREKHVSAEDARRDYLAANAKVTDAEIQETLGLYKDHPALKERSEPERRKAIKDYLTQSKEREVLSRLVSDALAKKELQIVYPEPSEPIYALSINAAEPARYGPTGQDAAKGCEGEACAVTVVEYSDFECPFCARVQPAAQQVLTAYRGRIRWVVRPMPLDIHEHARSAAIAAQCAKEQGKFWPMYDELFRSQTHLADADLKQYAAKVGLDEKAFATCVGQPGGAASQIARNVADAAKLGVSGTPTYFVNGRRVSGALTFDAFKQVIEQSLAKKPAAKT